MHRIGTARAVQTHVTTVGTLLLGLDLDTGRVDAEIPRQAARGLRDQLNAADLDEQPTLKAVA